MKFEHPEQLFEWTRHWFGAKGAHWTPSSSAQSWPNCDGPLPWLDSSEKGDMFLPNYYIWGYICFEIYIYLKTSEAASARKGYETNVWLAISWNRFVNYESPVFHFGSTGLLHLPKLLKGFNHINWNTYICLAYACIFGTSHNNITSIISILVKSSYRW